MPYALSTRFNKPVQIYYEDIGDHDLPILVMQHGDGNSSEDWKSLGYVEQLSPYFRLILIDYLGFGQSEKIYDPEAYTIPLLAMDTIAVLKHLKSQKLVTFLGGSMGGRVGYELAITPNYSKFFNGFIINGNGATATNVTLNFANWAKLGGMELVVEEIEKFLAPLQFPIAVKKTFLLNDVKSYIAANSNTWLDITDKLALINKPVLLICGECADELNDMKNAVSLIKGAELFILPGMNHAEAYWYGEHQVKLIVDFIDKV